MRKVQLAAGVVALAVLPIAGCADQRTLVGIRTLFDKTGVPDYVAISAALEAKFPPGSPVAKLENFVASIKGSCNERASDAIHCEVPITPPACYYDSLEIDAEFDGPILRTFHSDRVSVRC